jgi:phosphoadenosine phosphosulfate reductase
MSESVQLGGALAPLREPVTQSDTAPEVSRRPDAQKVVADLARALVPLDLFARVAAIRRAIAGRIVFTTSFGLEDQAIAHAVFTQSLTIEVVTLDTGRLFPETHAVWEETERRYGARIRAFVPAHGKVETFIAKHGIDGFRTSVDARHECCSIRKVAPLDRALKSGAAWMTGIRADQSADRAAFAPASFDARRDLIKVNPLFDWTRDRTTDFVRAHNVPYNVLHDRGYLSIGCAPCTRAVAPGEPERAGRWWWEDAEKKECGLHLAEDGRLVSSAAARS